MLHRIWHEDVLLGTIDLPRGQFVAGRLRPGAGYTSVAETVQRSTVAFLHLGLFYRRPIVRAPGPDADQWLEAIEQAGDLHFTLTDAQGRLVATHFVNLLDSAAGDGVVALICVEDTALGRPARNARAGPSASHTSLAATAAMPNQRGPA